MTVEPDSSLHHYKSPYLTRDIICRMGRWCDTEEDAERHLRRFLELGWIGTMRQIGTIWTVDVVRIAPYVTDTTTDRTTALNPE